MQLVGAFVIGHFSIDGKLKADHYNFSAMHNMFIINAPVETGCVKCSSHVCIVMKRP